MLKAEKAALRLSLQIAKLALRGLSALVDEQLRRTDPDTPTDASGRALEAADPARLRSAGRGIARPALGAGQAREPRSDRTDELLSFWAECDGRRRVHPRDAPFVSADRFALDLLPQPWVGPLLTADIFVLLLNPGHSGEEADYEQRRPDFREALAATLAGQQRHVFLDPRFSDHPGAAWTSRVLGRAIAPLLAERLCMVELVPYHSRQGAVATAVADRLPSSRRIRDWVKHDLRPRAERGEVALIVPRGARRWGFEPGSVSGSVTVYDAARARGAYMTPGTPGGDLIAQRLARPRRGA